MKINPVFALIISACAVMMLMAGGCITKIPSLPVLSGESGKITLTNEISGERVLLTEFERSAYMIDDKENLTILMVKGTFRNPTEALTIRMFWKPIPSQTPIDETATNATLHYVTFGQNELGQRTVGVYSGAGFLYIYNDVGGRKLSAGIWQANIRLSDSTEGFSNRLNETVMTGKLVAIRNDDDFSRALYSVNLAVNNALGYPRFIMNEWKPNLQLAAAGPIVFLGE
ncbi:hypothetical protein KS4_12680 [Poriferisphaera corsica]|uniref:Lipoprotein n=1 Tax=Poriferisphaera corsica TaxID=2528020 RepID=A0A517YSK6_9BACT|nr:hypothetical protein [Poriferisphaera corsica]QDU33223.1 hypothetical protein KS4_12680 [Poriferisphaera corsica]